MGTLFYLCILLQFEIVFASILRVGKVFPGLEGSQMNWIDKDRKFLVSNNGEFSFGFVKTLNDTTLFLLAVVHIDSSKVVWPTNRVVPVSNYDRFVFDKKGNAFLEKGGNGLVW
ncbi:hypothetical protein PIB30_061609 [Stylosanthes scabra]|uniref:Bulb-type lectin domain-containing protein n=1 Tax=Stylosanthes scabra TaxID=79078 RepID=A0ABU6XMF3_9FABA|nr:hypothetical protein [Stylosanthes scabra]